MYEIKDELALFFEAHWKQYFLLSIKLIEFNPMLAKLVDFFELLSDLNLLLQGKNIIKCTNDYNAINALVAKLVLGIVKFKREMQLPFLNYCVYLCIQ